MEKEKIYVMVAEWDFVPEDNSTITLVYCYSSDSSKFDEKVYYDLIATKVGKILGDEYIGEILENLEESKEVLKAIRCVLESEDGDFEWLTEGTTNSLSIIDSETNEEMNQFFVTFNMDKLMKADWSKLIQSVSEELNDNNYETTSL